MKLIDRKNQILHLVIKEYIKTGNPVGSKLICEKYNTGYSSATVRNDLASLEEEGYLTHPYTSAGRVPTDMGYRYYINDLMEIQRLTREEERKIREEFDTRISEIDKIMSQTSKMLAAVSEFAGFAISSSIFDSLVEYIELAKIGQNKLLAVIVTEEGLVKHKIIHCDYYNLTEDKIREISEILNKRLRGKKVSEVKTNILSILEQERKERELILNIAKDLTNELFSLIDENMYFLDEAPNFLTNFEIDEETYDLIKQKEVMQDILKDVQEKKGVNVFVGDDSPLKNCSLITSSYKIGDNSVGVLGIIGPKRMKYSKMVGIVDYIAKMFEKK